MKTYETIREIERLTSLISGKRDKIKKLTEAFVILSQVMGDLEDEKDELISRRTSLDTRLQQMDKT